jgi:putative oxidoreductase
MKWVVLAARVVVGLGFVVFGANYWLKFLTIPPPPSEQAGTFLGVLVGSHYLDVVKVLEVVGGLLLLSGRFTPLGVVVLMPVAANIALYDVLLAQKPALGLILTGLLAVVMAGYWKSHFAPFFRPTPA